jgi:hypothetical protein
VTVPPGNAPKRSHHAIRYHEQASDLYRAGETRTNVSVALRDADRLDEAHAYAEAALANFQTFGDRAADGIQKAERLIAFIDQAVAKKAGGA